jgi:hypothetical protein
MGVRGQGLVGGGEGVVWGRTFGPDCGAWPDPPVPGVPKDALTHAMLPSTRAIAVAAELSVVSCLLSVDERLYFRLGTGGHGVGGQESRMRNGECTMRYRSSSAGLLGEFLLFEVARRSVGSGRDTWGGRPTTSNYELRITNYDDGRRTVDDGLRREGEGESGVWRGCMSGEGRDLVRVLVSTGSIAMN